MPATQRPLVLRQAQDERPERSRRALAWGSILIALVSGVVLAGIVGWRINLESLDSRITQKRTALKRLRLSGRVPPNEEVMDYLTARQASLEERYQHWLQMVSPPPMAEAAKADPQLYFQEQFHAVQQTLERLATARGMAVPEQLGFPKELPPSDTVPRLLVQLALIQEVGELAFHQGVARLSSLKVEDPDPVSDDEGEISFLTRLPVRVRFTGSLPDVMKLLGALHRVEPLIDVRGIRIVPAAFATTSSVDARRSRSSAPPVSGGVRQAAGAEDEKKAKEPPAPPSGLLDVELLLARYLVTAPLDSARDAVLSGVERTASVPETP